MTSGGIRLGKKIQQTPYAGPAISVPHLWDAIDFCIVGSAFPLPTTQLQRNKFSLDFYLRLPIVRIVKKFFFWVAHTKARVRAVILSYFPSQTHHFWLRSSQTNLNATRSTIDNLNATRSTIVDSFQHKRFFVVSSIVNKAPSWYGRRSFLITFHPSETIHFSTPLGRTSLVTVE